MPRVVEGIVLHCLKMNICLHDKTLPAGSIKCTSYRANNTYLYCGVCVMFTNQDVVMSFTYCCLLKACRHQHYLHHST